MKKFFHPGMAGRTGRSAGTAFRPDGKKITHPAMVGRTCRSARLASGSARRKIVKPGLVLAALGLLVVLSTGCSARMKEAYHLRRGNHYYAAGQFDQAEIEYLNTVRNNPENFLAISRLGQIYFAEGRMQGAGQLLYRARQLNTNDLEVRATLARLYQAAGQLPAAREEARFVLNLQPQNPDAPITLAESVVTPADGSAARQFLDQLPPTANQAARQVALGILAFRDRDLTTAAADFQRAQTLDPHCAVAWSAMGILDQSQTNLAAAETAFKTAADLSPPRSTLRMNYANFEIQAGHPETADQFLAATIKETPDFVSAWILRAEIAIEAKKYDDCQTYLDGARAVDPDNYQAAMLGGQLDLARGDLAKAKMLLERLAHAYSQIPRVHYLLALADLANNEANAAVLSLSRALALQTNFTDAGLLLAQIQIKNGTPDPAMALLQQIIDREPGNSQARILLADACRVKGRFDDALAIYDQMEKLSPQNPGIPLLKGFVYMQQAQNVPARKAFTQALALAPNDVRVLDALMQLDVAEKQYDAAVQMLEKAIGITSGPGRYQMYLMEAKVYEEQNRSDRAVADLESAIKLNPDSPAAHLVLAQHYIKFQMYPPALDELQQVLQKNAANISAWMLQGQIYNEQKNYAAAAAAYEQMLVIDPGSSVALNNLGCLYSEHLGRLDKAYEMAQKARDLLPFDPATADTLGWVLYHRGDYSSALGLLAESLRRLPQSADVQYHYGKASYMLDRETAATTALQQALHLNPAIDGREECRQCLELLAIDPARPTPADRAKLEQRVAEVPDDPVALRRLAAFYQQAGDSGRAVQVNEALLKANPNDASAMLELARIYAATNLAKAFALAKKAYAAAPQDSEVSYLSGRLAFQTGDHTWALSLLKQTAAAQPDNPHVQYDLAQAAYAMGKMGDAQAAFQNALGLGLPDPDAGQARQWLALIAAAGHPALVPADRQASEAMLRTDPDNVPALMVSARALEPTSPSEAGQTYERVLNLDPDFTPAMKQLASLYLRDPRRLADAYTLVIKARQALPDDPELTKLLGMILSRQGDYQAAENYLSLSASARPDDAELYFELGFVQFHLKDPSASKESLNHALELKLSGQPAVDARQMLQQIH